MAAPKHLWSRGWESDSARRREELAQRSGEAPARAAPDVAPGPVPPADEPPTIRRVPPVPPRRPSVPRRKPRRPSRALILAAIAVLAVAGVAYALSGGGSTPTPTVSSRPGPVPTQPGATSSPTQPGPTSPPPVSRAAPWLGVQLESLPQGGMVIATVDPGSPAEQAGLEPGDVITQINNQPINGPADLRAATGGLRAGDTIEIQVSRGSTAYTTQVTLATRPTTFP